MSRNKLLIMLGSSFIFLILLTVFVFKVKGSSDRDSITGCTPYNVSISKDGDYKALIKWLTVEDCLGYVSYGQDREKLDSISVNNEQLSSKLHEIVIDKLLPSQDYFLIINSGEKSYGNRGVPLSFSLSSL